MWCNVKTPRIYNTYTLRKLCYINWLLQWMYTYIDTNTRIGVLKALLAVVVCHATWMESHPIIRGNVTLPSCFIAHHQHQLQLQSSLAIKTPDQVYKGNSQSTGQVRRDSWEIAIIQMIIHTQVCTYTHTHTSVHTHKRTHTHIHTQAHTQIRIIIIFIHFETIY